MSIFCAIAGHSVSARTIQNDGVSFSRCTRCSADLVETDGRWDTPRAGYRVVWKKREPEPVELSPSAPPLVDVPPQDDDTVLVLDNRSGADRRAAQSARVLNSLRSMDRRAGGERRKAFHKRQALSHE